MVIHELIFFSLDKNWHHTGQIMKLKKFVVHAILAKFKFISYLNITQAYSFFHTFFNLWLFLMVKSYGQPFL